MRKQKILKQVSTCIMFFFVASILGFLWEVGLLWMQEGAFCNRGFLYGPWLLVYGVGAVLIYLFLGKYEHSYIRVFFLSGLIGTGTELAVGWFLDKVWQLRYWDYSGYPLNFNGYICLWIALGFAAAGMVWVCFAAPRLKKLWWKFPHLLQRFLLTIFIVAFIFDCAAALIFPNMGKGVTY